MIILLSEYNMLYGIFNTILLQYNIAKIILYLYLDSPTLGRAGVVGGTRDG